MRAEPDVRAKIILSFLRRKNKSVRWLAKQIGKDHKSVGFWLSGASAPRDEDAFPRMLAVVRKYDSLSNIDELQVDVRKVGIRLIPVYPGISAGSPSSTVSDVELLEVKDWGTDRERWGRTIDGSSMEPFLMPGDIVVFEDRPAEPGHVVHACCDGEDTVKILRGSGPYARLEPLHAEYDAIPLNDAWQIKGVGMELRRKGEDDTRITIEFPHGMRVRQEKIPIFETKG